MRKEAEAVVKAVELKPNELNNTIISPSPVSNYDTQVPPPPILQQKEELPAKNLFSF